MTQNYLFTSERLGFRTWHEKDLDTMYAICSDPEVMEFFPQPYTKEDTLNFIHRMQQHFEQYGICYYAVDRLEEGDLIGFIGLFQQTFEARFTPCMDIGWRLDKKVWNQGYATEGALRCQKYAFENLKTDSLSAIAPIPNVKSQRIMQKLGMKEQLRFSHPNMDEKEPLRECVLYSLNVETFKSLNV